MRFNPSLAAGLALASTSAVSAEETRALHYKRLLHVSPKVTRDSVSMFPGRHPNHDGADLDFLVPQVTRDMYFAEEGHRSAVHGSKHAHLKATFKHPTVVLDQSNHVTDIKCSNGSIEICFENPKARDIVETSWVENTHDGTFHLLTYHLGCGDLSGHKRSYFLAFQPVQNTGASCVSVPVEPIDEETALESGEVSWGMYEDPKELRRTLPAPRVHSRAVSLFKRADDGGNVDIENDLAALEHFFNVTVDPNMPEPEDPIDFVEDDGLVDDDGFVGLPDGSIAQRDSSARPRRKKKGSVDPTLGQAALGFLKLALALRSGADKLVEQVADLAVEGGKLVYEAFTNGIDRPFHHDYKINNFVNVGTNNKGQLILGEKGTTVFEKKDATPPPPGSSKFEHGVKVACVKCGLEGDFTVDGRFAFHVVDGIRAGRLVIDMKKDAAAYARFGVTVNGKYPLFSHKQQFAPIPLSPIAIPGLFTVGPQLSFSGKFDLELSGEIALIFGGDVKISKGKAVLDLKKKDSCKIESGFDATFTPYARAEGKLQATAALGIPIAFEAGVDILNGKFKATVALINTPSAYISAGAMVGVGNPSETPDSPCKGIELRMGFKNKIEINALELWDLKLTDKTIYDKGLGCVSLSGFDKDKVSPPKSDIFTLAGQKLGGMENLNVNKPTEVHDVASRLDSSKRQKYWSIIMDKEEALTLVSGKDGYLYLTEPADQDSLTEAWGTLDPQSGFYGFDSLGRILNYNVDQFDKNKGFMAEIHVSKTTKMPKNSLPALIARIPRRSQPKEQPLFVFLGGLMQWGYPTFCKVPGQGLRLYATKHLIDKDGVVRDFQGKEYKDGDEVFTKMGLKKADCRTVNLESSGTTV